jgi:phage FluMu protein Com
MKNDVDKAFEMADRGDIVSTKSALAFDEDIGCKKCGAIFTLAEANYDAPHETYPAVRKYGFRCPKCENINWAYVKTPKLVLLEKNIDNSPIELRHKARKKYQREFQHTQRAFGMM